MLHISDCKYGFYFDSGGRHGAHIGRHARTSKRKIDLGYGMAGYDFRTLIMASELKHGLNYGFILHLYRNKC